MPTPTSPILALNLPNSSTIVSAEELSSNFMKIEEWVTTISQIGSAYLTSDGPTLTTTLTKLSFNGFTSNTGNMALSDGGVQVNCGSGLVKLDLHVEIRGALANSDYIYAEIHRKRGESSEVVAAAGTNDWDTWAAIDMTTRLLNVANGDVFYALVKNWNANRGTPQRLLCNLNANFSKEMA